MVAMADVAEAAAVEAMVARAEKELGNRCWRPDTAVIPFPQYSVLIALGNHAFPSAYAIQSLVEQVRCLAILNIIYVLFVFGSGDQTTFSFNTSAILRRQEGLYIVHALPWWEGGLSR